MYYWLSTYKYVGPVICAIIYIYIYDILEVQEYRINTVTIDLQSIFSIWANIKWKWHNFIIKVDLDYKRWFAKKKKLSLYRGCHITECCSKEVRPKLAIGIGFHGRMACGLDEAMKATLVN